MTNLGKSYENFTKFRKLVPGSRCPP